MKIKALHKPVGITENDIGENSTGSPSHEKVTNFGSLGSPSAPIPLFLKFLSMYILLASSKPTPLLFII